MTQEKAERKLKKKPLKMKAERNSAKSSLKLLHIASAVFAEKGYSGARVSEIVGKAGVNKHLLYYYFGSKEELYVKVLEHNYQLLRDHQDSLQIDDFDPVEGMKTLVGGTFDYFLDHPEVISLINTENLYHGKHIKQSGAISKMYYPIIERINGLLQKGVEDNIFREGVDPVDLYISIAGLGWVYISCQYTLSSIFNSDLSAAARIKQRRDHIIKMVLNYCKE